jgi:inosine/guanosine/xanthosine phosphorylase family protein
MTYENIQACAEYIRGKVNGTIPKAAMILGSGLNSLADSIENATVFPFNELPHFPVTTVQGHAGRMLVGTLEGKDVICLQGRVHGYEGHDATKLAFATRVLWALGVETLVITNAAGSLDVEAKPGSLMAITDHINLSGLNPLIGINDDRIGPRFPDMGNAWDKALTKKLHHVAESLSFPLFNGTYIMVTGPNFETPAEIRAFRTMGANAVGMSTVPECLAANHCGMKVVGISSITNYAAGMVDSEITHTETMEFGAIAAVNLEKLLRGFVQYIA